MQHVSDFILSNKCGQEADLGIAYMDETGQMVEKDVIGGFPDGQNTILDPAFNGVPAGTTMYLSASLHGKEDAVLSQGFIFDPECTYSANFTISGYSSDDLLCYGGISHARNACASDCGGWHAGGTTCSCSGEGDAAYSCCGKAIVTSCSDGDAYSCSGDAYSCAAGNATCTGQGSFCVETEDGYICYFDSKNGLHKMKCCLVCIDECTCKKCDC